MAEIAEAKATNNPPDVKESEFIKSNIVYPE
jgi:hypothetical protein